MKVSKPKKLFWLAMLGILGLAVFMLSFDFNKPKEFKYGVSFSRFHADELGLDWEEVYLAILNDLGVKNFRFSAHWPLTEPEEGRYNFKELDFQVQEAQKAGASVILAVGRRLPGWPECHEPDWLSQSGSTADGRSPGHKQERILKYIEAVVNRYKDYGNIIMWQVENEPFLAFFGHSVCGPLDGNFLQREIDLVKKLDPSRPVLITDGGEFGNWIQAYRRSDVFGTSVYLYIWNQRFNLPFRYPIGPWFFRIKKNLVNIFLDPKPIIAIEISSEPWLLQPIIETPPDVQLKRMGLDKFNEMIDFSQKIGTSDLYFWGAEWWYRMKLNGHEEYWERARRLVSDNGKI